MKNLKRQEENESFFNGIIRHGATQPIKKDMEQEFKELLSRITVMQNEILYSRYVDSRGRVIRYEDLADFWHVSPTQIRREEKKALEIILRWIDENFKPDILTKRKVK